jgi:hypothetical protein
MFPAALAICFWRGFNLYYGPPRWCRSNAASTDGQ